MAQESIFGIEDNLEKKVVEPFLAGIKPLLDLLTTINSGAELVIRISLEKKEK